MFLQAGENGLSGLLGLAAGAAAKALSQETNSVKDYLGGRLSVVPAADAATQAQDDAHIT